MQLHTRLALQFTLLASVLLIFILSWVYIHTDEIVRQEFNERLAAQARQDAYFWLRVFENPTHPSPHTDDPNDVGLPNDQFALLDSAKRFLFSDPPGFNPLPLPSRGWNNREQTLIWELPDGKQAVCVAVRYQGQLYYAVFTAVDRYGDNERFRLLLLLGGMAILGLLVLYYSSLWYIRRAMRPVALIAREARRVEATNLSSRLPLPTGMKPEDPRPKDELQELVLTFNEMLDRLETNFELQRRFVQHASHELNTPLTILRSEVELTLSRPRPAEEYRETLKSVLLEAEKLSAMAHGLLLLARLDGGQFRDQVSRVNICALVQETLVQDTSPSERERIRFDCPTEPVWINGNPTLLRVAVANLAQNALKYSESEVNISLSVSKTNVELVFADHGIGIPPHDLPNILKPLYRASNTAQVVGTGLGLTMVNRVAELHQAKLYIASDAGQGTTASLVFSLAEPL